MKGLDGGEIGLGDTRGAPNPSRGRCCGGVAVGRCPHAGHLGFPVRKKPRFCARVSKAVHKKPGFVHRIPQQDPTLSLSRPVGSGFGDFCSLPDDTEAAEGTVKPMANPEGSGFCDFCSLPDRDECVA